MTNVSDELVEQAFAIAHQHYVSSDNGLDEMRAALEAVLPVIERPWQERVEALEKALTSMQAEWSGMVEQSKQHVERARVRAERAGAQLAERDQEITALKDLNKRLDGALDQANIDCERLRERQFSDAEREALLDVIYRAEAHDMDGPLPDALPSARAKLEQGQ